MDLSVTINFSFRVTNVMAKIQKFKLRYLCAVNIEKELLAADVTLVSFPILKIFCSREVASSQQRWLLFNTGEVIPTYSAQSQEVVKCKNE